MLKTKTFHLHAIYTLGGKPHYAVFDYADMSAHGYVYIKPLPLEYDEPEDLDIVPLQVAALDKQIASVRAEATNKVTELQEQKARLLAITNEVAEA